MGTIGDKIEYTYWAVEDIRAALNERGINIKDIPLKYYGDLIRNIQTEFITNGINLEFCTKFIHVQDIQTHDTVYQTDGYMQIFDISVYPTAFTYKDTFAHVNDITVYDNATHANVEIKDLETVTSFDYIDVANIVKLEVEE